MIRAATDTLLVARFELLRAVRTWHALALIVLYLVAMVGFALLVVGLLSVIETEMANTLAVAPTTFPGALIDRIVADEKFRRLMTRMIGESELVDHVLSFPVLAIFHLWIGMRITPLLAAMTASESVSADMPNRAIRFELVRTGRMELVLGRFVGQAVLTGIAIAVASAGVWCVGMLVMVGNSPVGLAAAIAWFALRIFVFALPFVGWGIACSQLTGSSAWARVLAVGGTAVGWIGYAVIWSQWDRVLPALLGDVVRMLFPFEWRDALWYPGAGWLVSAVVLVGMGVGAVGLGYLRFGRRDV